MSVPSDPDLHLGVTGHRPDHLIGSTIVDLHDRAREVIATVIDASPSGNVTVLSPLAEGADRIVAHEALALGCNLICPLPFRREQYLLDFATAASRTEFRGILGQASEVVELPGTRATADDAQAAYATVGQYIVTSSDLLIAIWDGASARGTGGTADVVATAIASRIPVIWIDTLPPHRTRVVIDEATTLDDCKLDDLRLLIAKRFRQRTTSTIVRQ